MKTKHLCRPWTSKTVPADPATLWDMSKRILFAVARQVRQSVRLKLQGHGRGEAEPEELVNDAFVCIVEALPRFNPATASLTTFVYGLARRRMWLVARAAFYGSSRSKCTAWTRPSATPRYHRGERTLRVAASPAEDAERAGIRPQGRCHPAALADEGSPPHHYVLAGRRQLFRRGRRLRARQRRHPRPLPSAVPPHRGHGLIHHHHAGVRPAPALARDKT